MADDTQRDAVRRQLELVGERIRSLRSARHLSQVGFAVHAGFAGAYYSALERGKINFSIANLIRIARALGVEVGDLFPPMKVLADKVGDNEEEGTASRIAEAGNDYASDAGSSEDVAAEGSATFISVGVAANRFGVSTRTIERWVRQGTLTPAARVEDASGRLHSAFERGEIDRIARERLR